MKRLVNVSVLEFSTMWPSSTYIHNYRRYKIKLKIVSENIGIFKDKYLLALDGSMENIQNFLKYLKFEGFKIK